MANLWLDLKGPILADTVYINGCLLYTSDAADE